MDTMVQSASASAILHCKYYSLIVMTANIDISVYSSASFTTFYTTLSSVT